MRDAVKDAKTPTTRYTIYVSLKDSWADTVGVSLGTNEITSVDIARRFLWAVKAAMLASGFHPDSIEEAWEDLGEEFVEHREAKGRVKTPS